MTLTPYLSVETDYPIALDSMDHLEPHGALDQQGHEGIEFFKELHIKFPQVNHVLDFGTGMGTFVDNGIKAGFDVYGIEGTDKVDSATPWVRYKNQRLFHADLRHPFYIFYPAEYYRQGIMATDFYALFDLITAWDVMEHLSEDSIDIVMENITRHLNSGGYFMGTIEFSDTDNERYHTLCKPRGWWITKFEEYGFKDCGFDTILQKARHSPEENCFMLRRE